MLTDYGYIALYLVICLAFSAFIAYMPQVLEFIKFEKKKPSDVKYNTYECGLVTIDRSWVRFNPHYYYYALMLSAMDTSLIFLILWGLALKHIGVYSISIFWSGIIFVAIIACGFFYAWKKGVLQWK